MSGYYSNDDTPGYHTISGGPGAGSGFVISSSGASTGPTVRQGPGGRFRIVMPQDRVQSESVQSPQVIRIGPSGIRAVPQQSSNVPNVRVLERQPSGQMRVISGPSGSVQVLESPFSSMRRVAVDRGDSGGHGMTRVIPITSSSSGQPQFINMRPQGTQSNQPYRINVVPQPEEQQSSQPYRINIVPQPDEPQAYITSSSGPLPGMGQSHVYYSTDSSASGAPGTYTITRSANRVESPEITQRPPQWGRAKTLGNIGRSQSMDSGGGGGRVILGSSDGGNSTTYTTGPGGLRFTISGSGQESPSASNTMGKRGPTFYVRTNSGDGARRSSSPKIQVTRIQDALDSRRQQRQQQGNFDDVIQKKMSNFLQNQQPQHYLFHHQPEGQAQTQPKQEEYIYVSRPETTTKPGPPPVQRRDSTESNASSSSTIRPGKKIVRTTREEIRDIGGGQTQTIRETREELVSDDEDGAPTVQSENTDTWKSTSSNDSGTGSGDRDIFKKFRFKFDSIGNFGRSDSRESTGRKESFHFQDFDDMVGRMNLMRIPVVSEAQTAESPVIHVKNNTGTKICPYCKNKNPDCEYTCHNECRAGVTLDCAGPGGATNGNHSETSLSEAANTTAQADDADSGYHTGSSTLQSRGQKGRRPPGEWTLTREDLRKRIESFNNNNHGLIMSLQQDTNTFQGFIRVHMNLIRPINMSLSTRPTSIYDVIGSGEEDGETITPVDDSTQITSFYLPKDTTKVIHINSDTTTQEVIKALLSKFKITDNPRKFALYEKALESSEKDTMRRMEDDECPLPLCLCWTSEGLEGLDSRKFVLQENDTGEIMWEAFSLPELENFLKILNREEEEYVDQVKHKYRTLKIHMERRLVELDKTRNAPPGDGKRQPVYV